MSETTNVRVWDLPTRIFHWSLVILVVACWLTGEEKGLATLIHRLSGEAIAGLLVFRFLWGLWGGEYARFSSFFAPPREVLNHVKELFRFRAEPTLGHNPLGALASIILLLAVALTAATGLLSADDDRTGPLSVLFNVNLKELHETAFVLLEVVVVIHLLGVLVTSLASRENLARAMVTGVKTRPVGAAADAKPASLRAFIAATGAALLIAGGLMAMPHPPQESAHGADHHDGD